MSLGGRRKAGFCRGRANRASPPLLPTPATPPPCHSSGPVPRAQATTASPLGSLPQPSQLGLQETIWGAGPEDIQTPVPRHRAKLPLSCWPPTYPPWLQHPPWFQHPPRLPSSYRMKPGCSYLTRQGGIRKPSNPEGKQPELEPWGPETLALRAVSQTALCFAP